MGDCNVKNKNGNFYCKKKKKLYTYLCFDINDFRK